MFRKKLLLGLTLLGFFACNLFAAQVNSTWVGGPGNQWETASNWNPAIVPQNGVNTFVVTINEGRVSLSANHSVDSLDTYNTVKLTGQGTEVTLTNGLTNHGVLKMNGLDIYGMVTNSVGATIYAWSVEFNVYGEEGIRNFGTVFLDPAKLMWAEYDINNSGLIEMYGGVCDAAGNLTNNTAGIIRGSGIVGFETVQIDNVGLIESIGGTLMLYTGTISNTGILKNSPGASITVRTGLNNQGTIEINSNGAITFDSNLVNEPNSIIDLLDGTLAATNITQKAGATFKGFGNITGNVQLDPDAIIKLTGPTNVVGDVQIDPGATLEISDGTTLVTGHTTNNGTIHMKGGRIIPQGGITNNGQIIWEPGTYNNIADFNLDGKVDLKDFAAFSDTWLWQTQW
jgi:hypothetical protein